MIRPYSLFLSPLCLLLTLLSAPTSYAQQRASLVSNDIPANAVNAQPPPIRPSPDAIIRNFIAAETKFRETLVQFSFKRDVMLQTIGPQGEVTGEYIRNSVFVLGDRGERIERVLYHPKPKIKDLTITKEDIQDLAGSQLFGLELSELISYNLSYLGEESLNGRSMYLVAVSPKQVPDPRHMRSRFFVGRFWIDPVTFQPIYLEGITEPHGKQRSLPSKPSGKRKSRIYSFLPQPPPTTCSAFHTRMSTIGSR